MVAGRQAGRQGRAGEGGRARRATAPRAPPDVAMMQHSPSGAESQHAAAASRGTQRRPSHSLRRNKGDSCRRSREAAPAAKGGAEAGGRGRGGSEHVFASEKWPMPRGRRRRLSHTRRISHNCKYHSIPRESATDAARKTSGLSPPRPRRRRALASLPHPNREPFKRD